MYCYACGNKIYNGLLKCPYCGSGMESIQKILEEQTIEEIAKSCPEVSSNMFFRSRFRDGDVVLVKEKYLMAFVRRIYISCSSKMETEFRAYFDTHSCSQIAEFGFSIIEKLGIRLIYFTTAFLRKNGIADITTDDTIKQIGIINPYSCLFQFMKGMTFLEEFKQEARSIRSEYRTQRRTTWVGGGFGVRGAIKGRIMANVLNAGEGIAHAAGDAAMKGVMKGAANIETARREKELKGKEDVLKEIRTGFSDYCEQHYHYALQKLSGHYGFTYLNTPLQAEESDDRGTLKNGVGAVHRMNENPYYIGNYEELYLASEENRSALSELADFCGIGDRIYMKWIELDNKAPWRGSNWDACLGIDIEELKRRLKKIEMYETWNPLYREGSRASNDFRVKELQNAKKNIKYSIDIYEIMDMSDEIGRLMKEKDYLEVFSQYSYDNGYAASIIYNKFLEILTEQKQAESVECLKSLSERFQLAREIYLTYLFGKSSDNTVLEELYKAAIEGSAIPMACIGLQYCQGKTFPDFPKNVELGVEFLKKAAYKNNATALGKIGYFYKKGINGFPRNSQKGERLLMLSSECGDKFAKNQLRD